MATSFSKDSLITIVIMLPRQMGDVLLGTPLARILKDRFPRCKVIWCAHTLAKSVLTNNPYIDDVIYFPKKWQDELKFLKILSSLKADVVIDAFNNPKSAFLCFLTGASKRISFKTRWSRNLFFTDLIPREALDAEYHALSKFSLLKPLHVNLSKRERKEIRPELYVLSEVKEKIASYLRVEFPKFPKEKIILLSPTHRREVRRWPKEYFVTLAKKIVMDHHCSVLWLWGPGEKEYVEAFHDALQQQLPKDLKDETKVVPLFTIPEIAALCAQVGMWIGNSNGLGHVAVSARCKTVEIHGPTDAKVWAHPNTQMHLFAQRDEGCLKCGLNKCALPRRECLDDLSVEQVYSKVQHLFFVKDT